MALAPSPAKAGSDTLHASVEAPFAISSRTSAFSSAGAVGSISLTSSAIIESAVLVEFAVGEERASPDAKDSSQPLASSEPPPQLKRSSADAKKLALLIVVELNDVFIFAFTI